MKKQLFLMLLALPLIGYFACRKTDHQTPLEDVKDPFAKDAAAFVQTQLSSQDYASLDLVNYNLLQKSETETIGVRFNVKGKGGKKFAVVGKTDKGLIGNWVDVSDVKSGKLTEGVLKTSSFTGDVRREVFFAQNRVVKLNTVANNKTTIRSIRYNAQGEQIASTIRAGFVSPDMGDEDGWLPSVTVNAYLYSSPISLYSLFYYFNSNPYYTYTYQTTDPYTYGYGGGGTGGSTVVEMQAFEFVSGPKTDLAKRMNCFNNVPSDANTTYSLTLYADLPNNTNPEVVAVGTTPGHAFVKLTKTNGSTSVSQTFGFYPLIGAKSLTFAGVDSKVVNDGSHEYNASITIPNMPESEFNIAKNTALSYANLKYDLNDFNCANFAVGIFNSVQVSGVSQLAIPDQITGAGINYKTTPNGIYKLLKQMKDTNHSMASNIQTGTLTAPNSDGECN